MKSVARGHGAKVGVFIENIGYEGNKLTVTFVIMRK